MKAHGDCRQRLTFAVDEGVGKGGNPSRSRWKGRLLSRLCEMALRVRALIMNVKPTVEVAREFMWRNNLKDGIIVWTEDLLEASNEGGTDSCSRE